MATIGDTTRPAFAYDSATDTWIPVGVGPHAHTPAAIGAISNELVDAKGDLIAATAADTPARLAVGADNNFLQAASGQATGLQWGGTYTAYTPTFTNLTLGNGTVTARYLRIGKMCHVEIQIIFGTTTTIGAPVSLTLPFNIANISAFAVVGNTSFQDSGVSNSLGGAVLTNANTVLFVTYNTTGTYITEAAITPTVPFTWTNNDRITFSNVYEVA